MMNLDNLAQGGYIYDIACGKGKTSEIRDFILAHYMEGILYCVDSLYELGKMEEELRRCLVDTGRLREDEIIKLTSEEDERNNLHDYEADPTILTQKKIILITHVRFFTSLMNFFLIYRPVPQMLPGPFDGDFNTLLTRPDLRQWIFFDETPMWIQRFCQLNREQLGIFSEFKDGRFVCKSLPDIKRDYKVFIKDTPQDPFKHETRLDALKKNSVLSMVPKMYDTWRAMPKEEDIKIIFRPRDLNVPGMRTHILFFEGAADLLLEGSSFIPVSGTIGKKYNSTINFRYLHIGTKRYAEFKPDIYQKDLMEVVNLIDFNYQQAKQTLVVVWKNPKENDEDKPNDSIWRDKIRHFILSRLVERNYNPEDVKKYFDVIYYGENKCKSTNEFMTFSSIVLFGRWGLPTNKVTTHNRNWGLDLDSKRLCMWFFVQLISRIGIRLHNGGSYDVWMTDDYSPELVQDLDNYFNRDIVPLTKQQLQKRLDNILLFDLGIRAETKDNIVTLCDMYPEIKNRILNLGSLTKLNIDIPLDVVWNIVTAGKEHQRNSNIKRSIERLRYGLEKAGVTVNFTTAP